MGRRVVAIVIAVLLAGAGTAAVFWYIRGQDARAAAGRDPVTVFVASKRIPAGTSGAKIRDDGGFARKTVFPRATVPQGSGGAFSAINGGLENLVLTADVQEGQMLLASMFGQPSQVSGGLAIPDKMLAVSASVHADGAVANYVKPGSKVAIFYTFTLAEGKGRVPAGDKLTRDHQYNQATRLLLAHVEVIAVGLSEHGGSTSSGDGNGDTSKSGGSATSNNNTLDPGRVNLAITVAVTQDDATRLVHAATLGDLYLALLSDTSEVAPGPGVDNGTLFP